MSQKDSRHSTDDRDEIIQPLDFEPVGAGTVRHRWRPSRLLLTIASALLLTLLILLYLFSARSLYISTNAEAADIRVDGWLTLALGERFLLLPGEHEVHINAAGYEPRQQRLTIGADSTQHRHIELAPLPGHLIVDSNTPAQVSLNGEALGQSGERLGNIAAGEYRLQVSAERYQPLQQSLRIEGRDRLQRLSVDLQPDWAEVEIRSQPAGASVLADGEALGTTPMTAELLSGKHQLRVKLAGHKAWRQSLRVRAGESLSLPVIELQPADGLVTLDSQPAAASVTIDGQYRGQTPLEVALPPGQSYSVTLLREGYKVHRQQLSVESGREASLSVELQPELGQVSLSVSPDDALLHVDGRLLGRANRSLTLPARSHRLRISRAGYADHSTTVLPRPGLNQQLQIKLLTEEEHRWKNIARQLQSPTGQTLQLFKPSDTFTMGASRREQGRRANEAQRSVRLQRPFYLSETLVSNADYRRFQRFHSSGHVKGKSLNGERQPAVNISWLQAARYCNWLSEQAGLPPFYQIQQGEVTGFDPDSNGYRLPTEAEWAWAARLRDGQMLTFGWGAALPPPAGFGNLGDRQAAALLGTILASYDDGYAVTAPVASFPANHRGLYDIDGNAAEWVNDYYSIGTGLSLQTETDPLGPERGDYRVIRGSSWAHASITNLRLAFRDYGNEGRNDVGFRVARFVD